MSLRRRLRTLVACLVLETGVLLGVPVKAEQVQELLQSLNQPKQAKTDEEEAEQGEP